MTQPTLVLGVDYSDSNRPALDAAIAAAQEAHARLAIVHAMTPLAAPGLALEAPAVLPAANESADVLASQRPRAKRWEQRARDAGLEVEVVNRAGPAAFVVLEEAQRLGAEGIVVGTHGRTGLAKLFLGSVAKDIVKQSPVPVLVVPQDPAAMQHVVFPTV